MPNNNIEQSEQLKAIINRAMEICSNSRHEFLTPEHMLQALLENNTFGSVMMLYCDSFDLELRTTAYVQMLEKVPDDVDYHIYSSTQFSAMISEAAKQVVFSSAQAIDVPHVVGAMMGLQESWAAFMLGQTLGDEKADFMASLVSAYSDHDDILEEDDGGDNLYDDTIDDDETDEHPEPWQRLVTCLNDVLHQHNPLVGRSKELERTIQILCRKEKNNPLHVGEPGVGKTALVYGLTARIASGNVPARLQGCRVYQLDLGTLLAGTQFRGDFEKRIKQVMDGITREGHAIVYIDEIHNLVGAGAVGDSSMDASNMLKPYLERGDIRFIGSTTYEEYNKYFSRSKGLVRRFQQMDILEPTTDEAIEILRQLRPKYEEFHGVAYDDEALRFAVEASAKYVNDRFLPDKAIDLIDEAGAAIEMNATADRRVGASLIADVLAKTCKVDALALKEEGEEQLETLAPRLLGQIYGQDEAIRQVVEAVQMAKAGLLDDQKPLASLLFVGPTGVGKTEVARVLAHELGIQLVRFDMSEYTEKHTVAKLIGSPAGYVGYEDGGLLTDAIRRTPNCVLLLDEIEKAHSDIYNILLQVMDYARLTDNKGRKADFRNVIVIMTSNAGAQYAAQAAIGFNSTVSRGEAMLRQVKKTFKPEFLNRLSGTVVFRDMDRPMATLILRKKLAQLQQKFTGRQMTMTVSDEAFEALLREGFTPEYGAREMDRVIAQRLKPLLTREILFGAAHTAPKGASVAFTVKTLKTDGGTTDFTLETVIAPARAEGEANGVSTGQ